MCSVSNWGGYLQIAEFTTAIPNSSFLLRNSYVWDPTEKIATRPLAWNSSTSQPSTSQPSTSQLLFYTHDGNKKVSEVIAANGTLAAHYEYAPFGAPTVSRGTSAASNPWRFSSEYAEDDTATVYYNYRHYEPLTGRWTSRDPIDEEGGKNLYCASDNALLIDRLGLVNWRLLLEGFMTTAAGVLTAGGLILANASGVAAAPATGGVSAAVVAALNVAVVGWASMNIANGVSAMIWALADADETEPAQVAIARGLVEMTTGSPMSKEGVKSITVGYYIIDVVSCAYTFSVGVWSMKKLVFPTTRVQYITTYGVTTAEQHVKFSFDAATSTGPIVSGILDAWFYYSDQSNAVKVMTSDEYERERSSK